MVAHSAYIPFPKAIAVGSGVHLADYCALVARNAKITLGDRTTINTYARIQTTDGDIRLGQDSGSEGVKIGNGVRIGPQTLLLGTNHIFEARDVPIWKQGISSRGIVIEDNVWIGSNVTVFCIIACVKKIPPCKKEKNAAATKPAISSYALRI